jgi:hypothetical protein
LFQLFQAPLQICAQSQWLSDLHRSFLYRASAILQQRFGAHRIIAAMREQIQNRIDALRKELETGHAELEKVERQRTYVRETTLRIAGAIQVLEELLAEAAA